MKRKSDSQHGPSNLKSILKKKPKKNIARLTDDEAKACFNSDLFDKKTLDDYTEYHVKSAPYKHCVIHSLMNDSLLRSVRKEITENVHFTPKETDIYKIHQSGDLANLDGLEDAALEKLPSLLKLRDALYSPTFRKYVSSITGAGELSGRKTDMAINVYTPGCHLLCHDDVIGSRRVSYILYLTDPDIPWKEEWGGALRLYPTSTVTDDEGKPMKTPSPDFSKVIPPAWNQLSFFTVQPGESFHDVEEVYHASSKEQLKSDGGRIRMAISGWFHIPQIGEDGYVEGAEAKLAEKSSLTQLQGKAEHLDFPQDQVAKVEPIPEPLKEGGLEEDEIEFLLKYMAPTYLTPDTLEQVTDHFAEQSSVTLDTLLSKKFAEHLRKHVEAEEASALPLNDSSEIEKGPWRVAKPPHKHRFLYRQHSALSKEAPNTSETDDPIRELLDVFFPSRQFRKWLEITTGCDLESYDIQARRFRRGADYALATSHQGSPRLELSLCLTPTPGWGDDDEEEEEETPSEAKNGKAKNGKAKNGKAKTDGTSKTNGKSNGKSNDKAQVEVEERDDDDVGGHEVYMAGDEEDDNEDAAIYKSTSDEDDNVLFTVPASWNKMSIVLRDSGVLKFVKYVSKAAKGDRWDISGTYGVVDDDDEEQEGEEEAGVTLEDSEEEEFNGFPDSEDSDSD